MIIYPAIDIYEKKVVRLKRGDYSQMTVYSNDPVSVADNFKKSGAAALHVIDLEGARAGEPRNYDVIAEIAAATGLFVQVGGGIRTQKAVELYLSAGVSRVILGTAAISEPETLRACISGFGDALAVSADIKDGLIAVKGWTEVSGSDVMSFCGTVRDMGVKTIICTDISKDGMQSGANIGLYRMLQRELRKNTPPADIIASGGVTAIDEINTLKTIGISGVILGKALYEGTIDLKQALSQSFA